MVVKRKVSDLKPTSYNDLVEKIKQVWCQQITEDFCKTLVESMPDTIRAVLDVAQPDIKDFFVQNLLV